MAPFSVLFGLAAISLPVFWLTGRFRRPTLSAPNPVIYLVALLPAVFFFSFLQSYHESGGFLLFLILLAGSVGFAILWVRELIHLMGLSDGAFPGRHDKVMWFLLLVCLPPIGIAAFSAFRRAYWLSHKPALHAATNDLA